MKMKFALLCLTLLTVSCAMFTKARQSNAGKIEVGQSQAQVTALLGDPDKQMKEGEVDVWYYDIYSNDSSRLFPYTARFAKGVLKSFEKDEARGAEDEALRAQRKRAAPSLIDVTSGNGAPPIQGQ
jgi:outer membrane protein assembly factor BamE (lipoprotein component of BamABCDE complex)